MPSQAISEALGTGKVKKVPKEAALLNKDLPQSDFDMLTVNVRLEPGHVKDMSFEWRFEVQMTKFVRLSVGKRTRLRLAW